MRERHDNSSCAGEAACSCLNGYASPLGSSHIPIYSADEISRCLLLLPRQETYQKGECICNKGEAADKFYLIKEGEAALVDGKEVVGMKRAGECFGESSLKSGEVGALGGTRIVQTSPLAACLSVLR